MFVWRPNSYSACALPITDETKVCETIRTSLGAVKSLIRSMADIKDITIIDD